MIRETSLPIARQVFIRLRSGQMWAPGVPASDCAGRRNVTGLADNRALESAGEGMFPSYWQGNCSVFARRRRPSLTWLQSEATE